MTESVRHPGGTELTKRLLTLGGYHPPVTGRAADLGAGSGAAVRILTAYGFDAVGIDREPAENVQEGDILHLPLEDDSFDLVLSECALYLSGDPRQALREAARIVKQDGKILIADVFPVLPQKLPEEMRECGLQVLFLEDHTEEWKEYIIECLWQKEYVREVCSAPKNSRYYLIGLQRWKYE
ncbi:MAG: class I SAM-dependent methyltransferase [Solobacterium sp.]|nr:class I SAM-dependent methyltransferase [Solobacterium sp.]